MAVPPVADKVDDGVLAEAAAEGEREPDCQDGRLGVIGVDMDDRDVEALRQVAQIARRTLFLRIRGEADLVVGDDVSVPPVV